MKTFFTCFTVSVMGNGRSRVVVSPDPGFTATITPMSKTLKDVQPNENMARAIGKQRYMSEHACSSSSKNSKNSSDSNIRSNGLGKSNAPSRIVTQRSPKGTQKLHISPATAHMHQFRPSPIATVPLLRTNSLPLSVKDATIERYAFEDERDDECGSDDGATVDNTKVSIRSIGKDGVTKKLMVPLDDRSSASSVRSMELGITTLLPASLSLVTDKPSEKTDESASMRINVEETSRDTREVLQTPTNFETFVPSSFRPCASTQATLVQVMVRSGIRLLAIDFDKTLVGVHTRARWRDGAALLAQTIRPIFRSLVPAAINASIAVAIVTFSKQEKLIKDALLHAFGGGVATRILVRTDKTPGLSKRERGSAWETGKQWHLLSALEEIGMCAKSPRGWGDVARALGSGTPRTPVEQTWGSLDFQEECRRKSHVNHISNGDSFEADDAMQSLMRGVVLVDDDMRNIRLALRAGVAAFGFVDETQLREDLLKRFGSFKIEEPAGGTAWASTSD